MYDKLSDLPGSVIGYRKDGRPIRLLAGGDQTNDPKGTEPEGNKNPQPASRVFTEEELNRLLERERNKLYSRMTKTDEAAQKLQEELDALKAAESRRAKEEEKRRKDAEAAAKKAAEAEMSALELIEKRQAEWEAQRMELEQGFTTQLTALQKQLAERDAIMEQERRLMELRQYAQAKIAEAGDSIAPQFLDYIGGDSTEQIDAAIEQAVRKTAEIVAEVQRAQISQRAAMPGVRPAGFTPTGPIDLAEGGTKELSPEDIKNMPISEYVKLRDQLGIGKLGNSRGLFG